MPCLFSRLSGACSLVVLMSMTASPNVRANVTHAVAAASDNSVAMTLREAITRTLQANPRLRQFEYTLRAQDARIDAAGSNQPLEVSVELENALGTSETKGFDAAEATFALSRVIELGGKREHRIAVASLDRDGIQIDRQAAQLDALAEVSRRFIHVASDERQLLLTQQAVDLAQHTVDAVKRRVDAAKSPEVEWHRANVELIRARIALEHAQHELLTSRVKLSAMWGEIEPRFTGVNASLDQLPQPVAFNSLIDKLRDSPDFTRFASTARLRDAEIRLAQSQRRPDFKVSAGIRRLEASDDQALVFGFSMPIGSRTRAAPGIAEATAKRAEADVSQEIAFLNARAQLFELYQELHHSVAEAKTLSAQVLPQMQEALSETEYAYERGRYSYLELVDSQRAYLDVQSALIEASASAHMLQVEIERLTAQPLTPAPVASGVGQ